MIFLKHHNHYISLILDFKQKRIFINHNPNSKQKNSYKSESYETPTGGEPDKN